LSSTRIGCASKIRTLIVPKKADQFINARLALSRGLANKVQSWQEFMANDDRETVHLFHELFMGTGRPEPTASMSMLLNQLSPALQTFLVEALHSVDGERL
jgi:hypothetical protein